MTHSVTALGWRLLLVSTLKIKSFFYNDVQPVKKAVVTEGYRAKLAVYADIWGI